MKFTTKLLIFWSSVYLFFLLGIVLVMSVFWNTQFVVWQLFVAFVINGVIPPAIITSFFYRRLEYMESEDDTPPTFKGVKKLEIPFEARTSCPFDEMMQQIDRQYIVSYSDRKNKILKFRTDTRMLTWGLGGYLRMNDESIVEAYVYPIHKNSKREGLTVNQTLRVLWSIFRDC